MFKVRCLEVTEIFSERELLAQEYLAIIKEIPGPISNQKFHQDCTDI